MRWRPAAVLGPVESPPWLRQRPLSSARRRQSWPRRVRAPHKAPGRLLEPSISFILVRVGRPNGCAGGTGLPRGGQELTERVATVLDGLLVAVIVREAIFHL